MNSAFLKFNSSDFIKGLAVVVLAVVFGALQQALTAHGFDFAAYDWSGIFNMALTAGGAYLSKNLLSDTEGKVLGKIG